MPDDKEEINEGCTCSATLSFEAIDIVHMASRTLKALRSFDG
jgi:hypothetical protein